MLNMMMVVQGQCTVVSAAGSIWCGLTWRELMLQELMWCGVNNSTRYRPTCDVVGYTGSIAVVRSGTECYREGRALLVLTMHVDGDDTL